MSSADELVACCTECKSIQPDQYIERSPFYQQGDNVPCKYCKGVTMIVRRGSLGRALEQVDIQRGLYNPEEEDEDGSQ